MSRGRLRTPLERPRYARVSTEPKLVYALVAVPVDGVLVWDVNDKQAVTVAPNVD